MVHKIDTSTYLYKLSKRLWKSSSSEGLGIPNSTVFYVRWALFEKTGELFSPEHVQIALWLEGHLPPKELTSIPGWYVEAYMNGVVPDMQKLTEKVTYLYNLRQKKLKDIEIEVDKFEET